MADELVMPARETKFVMLLRETLNSWCHVTFGTQVVDKKMLGQLLLTQWG